MGEQVFNIVAFSRQASFKVDDFVSIMYWRNVVPYIRHHREALLIEEPTTGIYNIFLSANVADKAARKVSGSSVKNNGVLRDMAVAMCNSACIDSNGNAYDFYKIIKRLRYGF